MCSVCLRHVGVSTPSRLLPGEVLRLDTDRLTDSRQTAERGFGELKGYLPFGVPLFPVGPNGLIGILNFFFLLVHNFASVVFVHLSSCGTVECSKRK